MKQLIATACATFIFMNAVLAMQFAPRFIGYGCEGTYVPQLAKEEDHFPRCERIERIWG